VFDRQDSLRSDYLSDRETRYGIVQQASIDSTDSRLCYLTSSEVSEPFVLTRFACLSTTSDELHFCIKWEMGNPSPLPQQQQPKQQTFGGKSRNKLYL